MEKWKTEERCKHCDHVMSHEDIFCNRGVCPYCAHKNKTTAYALTRVVRFKIVQTSNDCVTVNPPWWAFWRKPSEINEPGYTKELHPDDIKT